MRLYKEYKEEQEQNRKLDEDKENVGLPEGATIIYETPSVVSTLKSVVSVLVLILILLLLCSAIIFAVVQSTGISIF